MAKKKSSKQVAESEPRDTFSELLGNRLRELRLIREVTAEELSKRMSVNTSRVLSIETAGRDLQVNTVRSYCRSLDFELVDVFEEFPHFEDKAVRAFVARSIEAEAICPLYDFDNEDFAAMCSRIVGLCRKYPSLSEQGGRLINEAAFALARDDATPMARWFKRA